MFNQRVYDQPLNEKKHAILEKKGVILAKTLGREKTRDTLFIYRTVHRHFSR